MPHAPRADGDLPNGGESRPSRARARMAVGLALGLTLFCSPRLSALDAPARTEEMEKLEQTVAAFSDITKTLRDDTESVEIEVYQCRNIRASTLRRTLQEFITPRGTVSANEETDQVVIADVRQNLAILRAIIEKTDRHIQQILVEAQIVEFAIEKDFEKEVRTAFTLTNASSSFVQSMTSILNTPGANPNNTDGAQFTLLPWSTESQQLSVFLRHLETRGRAKILSAPNLVIRQGGEGNIFVGEDVPIVTTEMDGGNLQTSTTFRSTGIKLNVTPRMIVDGKVRLDVNPEVSDVTGESTTGNVSNPIISVRQVRTQLDMLDGQTLAIGGLLSTKGRHTTRRVPILSAVPVIGPRLFQSERMEKDEVQLVVFLKVKLLHAEEPVAAVKEVSPEADDFFRTLDARNRPPAATLMQDLRNFAETR